MPTATINNIKRAAILPLVFFGILWGLDTFVRPFVIPILSNGLLK